MTDREDPKQVSPSKLHDAFFHDMMTDRKVQIEFLQAYLPAAMQRDLDWEAVRVSPDHFVTAEWSQRNADLLFELTQKGEPLYLYLLLEHQSTPDPLMPLRLLEYQIQIWRRHVKEQRDTRLPYIHAILFYTGKDAYRYTLSIKDMIQGPAELIAQLWDQPFQLIDLKVQDFERLATYVHLSTLLTGFRMQFVPSITNLVSVLAEVQSHLPDGDERRLFDILLTYLFHLRDDLEPVQLAEEANRQHQDALRSKFVSVAHRLIEKGRDEGIAIGVEKGRDEGIAIGVVKGRGEGIAIGFEKGLALKEREVVQKLYATGLSIETIAQTLTLDASTVQRYLIAEVPSDPS